MRIQLGKLLCILLSPIFLFLLGCAGGSHSYNTQTSYIPAPLPGQAMLTFFWPAGLSAPVTTIIASSDAEGNLTLTGTISPGQRIVQNLNPGNYTYVMGSHSEQVLQANIESNKHYYVRIEAQWIDLFSGFTFVPLSPQMISSHPDLQIGLMACQVVVPNATGEEWFRQNYDALKQKLVHPSQIFQLKASDGFNVPIGGL